MLLDGTPGIGKSHLARKFGELLTAPVMVLDAGSERASFGLVGSQRGWSGADGRPISFFITAGQISDYIGAAALLSSLPPADWILADRVYDANWFSEALKDKGIKRCVGDDWQSVYRFAVSTEAILAASAMF